jgi:hypothetical protein
VGQDGDLLEGPLARLFVGRSRDDRREGLSFPPRSLAMGIAIPAHIYMFQVYTCVPISLQSSCIYIYMLSYMLMLIYVYTYVCV